jgi:hypothetical protein
MLIASALLALVIGAAFAVLLSSVADLRAWNGARQAEEVLEVANPLERQVVDVETAQRGSVLTRQERAFYSRGGMPRRPSSRRPLPWPGCWQGVEVLLVARHGRLRCGWAGEGP